jgi:pimeloyl-ACP methyl ester carboxylesterase
MRGLGDSTHQGSDYEIATVADDLAELMQRLGHEKFHLRGEDWGAADAYQVAARYPERVSSLIFQEMLFAGVGVGGMGSVQPRETGNAFVACCVSEWACVS